MSGIGEAIAIVSCVAGLIQAYDAASRTIDTIKVRRRARQAAPPTELLEKSVERGKQQISDVVEEGKERFGATFENGDDAARNALKDITIATQAELLEQLADARADDDIVDFSRCIRASNNGRLQALIVLNEYILRREREEQEAESVRAKTAEPDRGRQIPEGQPGGASRASEQQGPVSPSQQTSSSPLRGTQRSRTFPRLQTSPTVVETNTSQTARPRLTSLQSTGATSSLPHSRTPSGSTQASSNSHGSRPSPFFQRSVTSIESNNTRSTDGGSNNTLHSLSRTSTSQTQTTSPPASESFDGECCKYALRMQDGDYSKGLQLRNVSFTPGANNCIFWCRSRKCKYQIPAIMNEKRDWVLDTRVRSWKGLLEFRPIFLAKCHVPTQVLLSEQRTRAQYHCIICMHSGERTGTFTGFESLLEHVLGHAGADYDNLALEGPLTFSSTGVNINADFDINLPETSPALISPTAASTKANDAVFDAEIRHELDKLEIGSRRSSYTSQETDPTFNPW